MKTSFKYNMILEREGQAMEFHPVVNFAKEEQPYYGNGYHMIIRNVGLEPFNSFDMRYDSRLDEEHLDRFFPVFAEGQWTGTNGSAKLISIEEVK